MISYNRESNSTGLDEFKANETKELLQTLAADDNSLWEYIEEEYGVSCTVDDCRRRAEEDNADFQPFNVQNITSSIDDTQPCEAFDVNKTCHTINTLVSVEHYPVQFPPERVGLICVSKTLDFMEERSITITPLVPVPQPVETRISLTFKGVDPMIMTTEEIASFVDTTFEFLRDVLGRYDPPILIEDVAFDAQELRFDVIATEDARPSERNLNQTDLVSEETASLKVNITVYGEYLPPPEIVFDAVVVEVFENEEEAYIEQIDESDNAYFEPVISKISVSAEAIPDVEAEISKSSSESAFGILGDEGGVATIMIGCVVVLIIFAVIYRKHTRLAERENAEMKLREQHIERDARASTAAANDNADHSLYNVRATLNNRLTIMNNQLPTVSGSFGSDSESEYAWRSQAGGATQSIATQSPSADYISSPRDSYTEAISSATRLDYGIIEEGNEETAASL